MPDKYTREGSRAGIVKHIVSFSGGKDSTAMLLMMLEKGMQVDDIVFCDTGMEFPAMYEHIKQVEDYTKRNITTLKANHSFKYYLGHHKKKNGGIGYGFPDFRNRWCTTLLKRDLFKKHYKNIIDYQGIAIDEKHRSLKNQKGRTIKYPLIEWNVTEAQALQYCYDKGFTWNGLYKKFNRVSCWCCPLSRIGELRILHNEFPELWIELKELDKLSYRQFRSDYSVNELEDKFLKEK